MISTRPEPKPESRTDRRNPNAVDVPARLATDGLLTLLCMGLLLVSLSGCFGNRQAAIHPSIALIPFQDEAGTGAEEPLVRPEPVDISLAGAHPYHWARAFGFASAEAYYRSKYGSVPDHPAVAAGTPAASRRSNRTHTAYTDASGVTWRRARQTAPRSDAFELRRTAAAPFPARDTAGTQLAAGPIPAEAPLTGAGAGSDSEALPPPPPSPSQEETTDAETHAEVAEPEGMNGDADTVGALPPSLDVAPAETPVTEEPDEIRSIAPNRAIEAFDEGGPDDYRLGAGDAIAIEAWNNSDISGQHFIGPDGKVTLSIIGPTKLTGLTREEAAAKIEKLYEDLYPDPTVTIRVLQYNSNKVFMLGAVRQPGVIRFEDTPTLLDAISRAGGVVSTTTTQQVLPSCAVMRGNDRIAWINLQELLGNGVLSLNIRLHPNDTIYVPDWKRKQVFVMGSVQAPGMYAITPNMTVLDALGRAGGPTQNAAPGRIWLVRPSEQMKQLIDFSDPRDMTPLLQAEIEPGDILFVPQNRIAKFSYVVSNLTPQSWFYFGEDIISGDFDGDDND